MSYMSRQMRDRAQCVDWDCAIAQAAPASRLRMRLAARQSARLPGGSPAAASRGRVSFRRLRANVSTGLLPGGGTCQLCDNRCEL